jgi:membrane protease YdiL (CAAX protease family)
MAQKPRRLVEAIARWLATVATALFCALSVISAPFGCAVGEYEEHRNCDTSALSWVGAGVLVGGVVFAMVARRPRLQWLTLGVGLAVSYAGALQA